MRPPQRDESGAERSSGALRGMRMALIGLVANAGLFAVKLSAGILGHSYALIADAIESSTDIFASLIVFAGLRITTRPADDEYPYGYGKAEPLATAAVALMLLGAALGIALAAVREIVTPHHAPAAFTLVVIASVVVIKEALSRWVVRVAEETGGTAVRADAGHHRSDAITSAAAFIGIAIALWGGPGWESADDWAALAASGIIAFNGVSLLRVAVRDLMDRMPEGTLRAEITAAALRVPGVLAVEKLMIRRLGMEYHVDLHVQAEPAIPLYEAHILSGKVKGAIRAAVPNAAGVLIHMEPFEGEPVFSEHPGSSASSS